MMYTRFFAQINKEQGLQRLSHYQLARILNIVLLEGELKGLGTTSELLKNSPHTKAMALHTFKKQKRLTQLTGNKQAKALMQEICYLSENEK